MSNRGEHGMHGLLGLAGLLGLVALAFGPRAASSLAAVILALSSAILLWMAYLVIFEKI